MKTITQALCLLLTLSYGCCPTDNPPITCEIQFDPCPVADGYETTFQVLRNATWESLTSADEDAFVALMSIAPDGSTTTKSGYGSISAAIDAAPLDPTYLYRAKTSNPVPLTLVLEAADCDGLVVEHLTEKSE